MKKRNIIIISLSTIGLVFGGLVFLGISAFPELLKVKEDENVEAIIENDFDDAYALMEEVEEPVVQEAFEGEFVSGADEAVTFVEETLNVEEENYVIEIAEPEEIVVEEIVSEPIIEEEIVEEVVVKDSPVISCGSSTSEIDYQVTFVPEHCTVLVSNEEVLTAQSHEDELNFEIVLEEGYVLDLNDVIISDPLCEEYMEEDINHISNIHSDIVITISPTYVEEAIDAEEAPLLIKEEKQEVLDVNKVNNNAAITNTTIITIGICEVLAFILVKRKRHLR